VVKGLLAAGEHKSIQTDRVILVPGPANETDVVRSIYEAFVHQGLSESTIAEDLNSNGLVTDRGRPWSKGTVHQILINEKYVGNNVWNRTSFKLKTVYVHNQPEQWVRSNGVFAPIVDRQLFDAAQAIILERSYRIPDEEMLSALNSLLKTEGLLSGILIDEAEGLPSSSNYRSRFGSLLRAYSLIGYNPERDYRYIETNRHLREMQPETVAAIISEIAAIGGVAKYLANGLVSVNEEFTVSIVLARCAETEKGSRRWLIHLDTGLQADISVAARMDESNTSVLDYYLLPRLDMTLPKLRLAEANGVSLDCYRFDSLSYLFQLAARTDLLEVA
jgi:hypothetical protein